MDDTNNDNPLARLDRIERAIGEQAVAALVRDNPFSVMLTESGVKRWLDALILDLGARYAPATLRDYEATDPVQKQVRARLINFTARMPEFLPRSAGLVLFGPVGTGKDHLVAAMLKAAVAMHRLSALWIDGGDLFNQIFVAIKDENPAAFVDLQKRLVEPHILAISDPQPPDGELSQPQKRRFRDIIDARYRRGVATWITTNALTSAMAVTLLSEQVISRLEDGSAIIECNWPSYRSRRKAEW